jgi:cGMP-dependent protein kinase
MMCTNGYLKLVDMGTAKKLKIERRYRTNTIIGTPHYMAP